MESSRITLTPRQSVPDVLERSLELLRSAAKRAIASLPLASQSEAVASSLIYAARGHSDLDGSSSHRLFNLIRTVRQARGENLGCMPTHQHHILQIESLTID